LCKAMAVDIVVTSSLAIAGTVTGGILYLLWKLWRDQTLEELNAFANSLPEDERAIFWRLHKHRDLWNTSRYPKAFRQWRRQSIRRSSLGVRLRSLIGQTRAPAKQPLR